MADYQTQKAAAQARLKTLDADEKRIGDKKKATQAQIAAIDAKLTAGPKAPKAAKGKK